MPVSYAARAKKIPEEPAINVLSRSKNAAGRNERSPFSPAGRSTTWFSPPAGALMSLGQRSDAQNQRVALPAARADRRAAEATAAAAQLVDERAEDARAGGADRVAEGDRAAVDVHAVLVDPQHADRVQGDRGEGLVDLPNVDVLRLQAGLLQGLLRGARGRRREVGEVV